MSASILVIDDSASIREIVSWSLRKEGYAVYTGQNGKEGLQSLNQHPSIKLIISDLNMPVMDGLTFLKEIRNREKSRFIPVIILTTESQAVKREEARLNGATAWLIKPFDSAKLISVVKKAMR
jgi:two-component system, chemotaxis family, chemotaxis protein CheY